MSIKIEKHNLLFNAPFIKLQITSFGVFHKWHFSRQNFKTAMDPHRIVTALASLLPFIEFLLYDRHLSGFGAKGLEHNPSP